MSVIKLWVVSEFFDRKSFQKGENSFLSNNILSFHFNNGHMDGKVAASMRSVSYDVKIYYDKDEIKEWSCTCPRGQDKCHHMAALLIYANRNVSKTDIACSWMKRKSAKDDEIKTVEEMHPPKKKYTCIHNNPDFIALAGDWLKESRFVCGLSWWLVKSEPTPQGIHHVTTFKNLILENLIFSNEFLSIATGDKEMFLRETFDLNSCKIESISRLTVDQGNNILWCKLRQFRITASNFSLVLAAINRNRYPPSLFKRLVGSYKLDNVKAVQWGKTHEKTALQQFEKDSQLKVRPTGLWLHEYGFLGASPDGLIINEKLNVKYCIEVKCPYKYRNDDLNMVLKNNTVYIVGINDDNAVYVNTKHQYFDQIQGQLYLTDSKSAVLLIWSTKSLFVTKIERDSAWVPNIKKLNDLYINVYLPWLLDNKTV